MNMFMWKSKIKSKSSLLTRRDFLKLAAVSTGALAFRSLPNLGLSEFPQSEKLGRVAVGKVEVFSRPDDQTHFPFLHPDTVGTPEYARSKLNVSTDNNQVTIRRELRNSPPPGVYGMPADIMHKRVDRTSKARFVSPALHVAFAQILDPSPDLGKPQRYRYNFTHCFTPETNTSIHYWWFNSRDYKPDDTAIDTFLYEASSKAYHEDVDALEWIMDVVRNDVDPQIDLSFASDKPGLMARRIMYRLAKKELY